MKSHNALVKHLKLSACSEDFEMKKLLVTLIVSLSADRAVLRVLIEITKFYCVNVCIESFLHCVLRYMCVGAAIF